MIHTWYNIQTNNNRKIQKIETAVKFIRNLQVPQYKIAFAIYKEQPFQEIIFSRHFTMTDNCFKQKQLQKSPEKKNHFEHTHSSYIFEAFHTILSSLPIMQGFPCANHVLSSITKQCKQCSPNSPSYKCKATLENTWLITF